MDLNHHETPKKYSLLQRFIYCVYLSLVLCSNGEAPLEIIDSTKVNKSTIVPEPNNVTYGEELVYLYPSSFKIIIRLKV